MILYIKTVISYIILFVILVLNIVIRYNGLKIALLDVRIQGPGHTTTDGR
jgi:hypothetical protein